MHRMHADLVRAAGAQLHLEQRRKPAEELHDTEVADRRLAACVDFHRTLATDAQVRAQRRIDTLCAEFPLAADEHEIAFVEGVLAQQRMQRAQRRTLARHQQAATGVAVEAMHQLQRLFRP